MAKYSPSTDSIVLQEGNERKDGQIQNILLLKLKELLLKLKKWKLNECSLISKKIEMMEQKFTHEEATATVFTENSLVY